MLSRISTRREQEQRRGLAGGGFETQLSPASIPGRIGCNIADGPPQAGERLAQVLQGLLFQLMAPKRARTARIPTTVTFLSR
jgi:hypothetical protein